MSLTIRDIARRAGVNASTVSRALKYDPRVKEATAQKLRTLASRLGYIPNESARNLADGRTKSIAFLAGTVSAPVEREPACVLNRLLLEKEYTMMILLHDNAQKIFSRVLEKIAGRICDGAVIIAPGGMQSASPEIRERLSSLKIPVVFLDRKVEHTPFPVVTTDSALSVSKIFDCFESENCDGLLPVFGSGDPVVRDRMRCVGKEAKKRGLPLFSSAEELFRKAKHPAVFGNTSGELAEIASAKPWTGGCFDPVTIQLPRGCFRISSAIQDCAAMARTSADLLLELMDGKKPSQRTFLIPPLKITSTPEHGSSQGSLRDRTPAGSPD